MSGALPARRQTPSACSRWGSVHLRAQGDLPSLISLPDPRSRSRPRLASQLPRARRRDHSRDARDKPRARVHDSPACDRRTPARRAARERTCACARTSRSPAAGGTRARTRCAHVSRSHDVHALASVSWSRAAHANTLAGPSRRKKLFLGVYLRKHHLQAPISGLPDLLFGAAWRLLEPRQPAGAAGEADSRLPVQPRSPAPRSPTATKATSPPVAPQLHNARTLPKGRSLCPPAGRRPPSVGGALQRPSPICA